MSNELVFIEEQRPPERLGFIIVVATAMHLAVILGLNFAPENARIKLPSLEITLAQYHSKDAPDEADYLAQYDQIGSGSLDQKAELSSMSDSAFHDTAPSENALKLAKNTPQNAPAPTLNSSADNAHHRTERNTRMVLQQHQWQGSDKNTELSDNIASLEAQLDTLNQAYARMPRPKFITSVATKGSPDALYLNRWEQRIEEIGNANYPEEARRKGIEGELRLLLMLMPDGRIDEVRILSSSGSSVLDQAAHRIVRKAAPFERIPAAVLDGKNRLGIVRTWRFERQGMKARQN